MYRMALIVLLAMLFMPAPAPAGDLAALAAGCDDCHGPNGQSTHADVPIIAGQSERLIGKALDQFADYWRPCSKTAYRHGDTGRPETSMCEISAALSAEDRQALSAHYASQPFVPAVQAFDEAKAVTGAGLYGMYCATCHPAGGTEIGYAGRLAGQWQAYLRTSIAQIAAGEWMVPKPMERKMSSLSEEEIDALVNYFASHQD